MSIATDPHYDRLHQYLDSLKEESDRGMVLISAAVIEDQIRDILSAFMLEGKVTDELFRDGSGVLSDFASKVNVALSLALLSADEARDLHYIRRIRNEFAHKMSASFNGRPVADFARQLKLGMERLDGTPSEVKEPRYRFSMCAMSHFSRYYNRAVEVRAYRLEPRPWS